MSKDDFLTDTLKIGLGIALGGFILWGAAEYRSRYLVSRAEVAIQRELEIAVEQRRLRAQTLQQQRLAAAAAEQRRIEAGRRKARAWAEFFQPSQQCLETASVECGNAHIRARREFERLYGSGLLSDK